MLIFLSAHIAAEICCK